MKAVLHAAAEEETTARHYSAVLQIIHVQFMFNIFCPLYMSAAAFISS
jgi:hypothetical protein